MAKSKAAKVEMGEGLAKCFNEANASIVAEYSGITAEQLVQLRRRLRNVGCEFKVIKNRVAKKAIESKAQGSSAISSKLHGPIGVVYVYKDIAAASKTMLDYARENEKLKITGGLLEGRALSVAELKQISELPTKDVLLSRIVGAIVSPHRQLLGVLSAVSQGLVRTISAIKDTKSK